MCDVSYDCAKGKTCSRVITLDLVKIKKNNMAVCRETTLQPLILLILQRRIEPHSGRESFQYRYTIMLEVSRNHYNHLTSV